MTALVIAEHDNASIKGATLNTVTAALACGGEVHVLVAGHNAGAAAAAAAQIAGVAKVLHADGAGHALQHLEMQAVRHQAGDHRLANGKQRCGYLHIHVLRGKQDTGQHATQQHARGHTYEQKSCTGQRAAQ